MSDAAWYATGLRSPTSGATLVLRDGVLCAGDELWPVVDGIPFLRADRVGMARAAADKVRAGDPLGAAALLLTDQDPFAPDPPPSVAHCRTIAERRDALSFRDAMAGLGFGRVGDYFAHRWTDPTFLSGLALLGLALPDAAPTPPVLELACGAGHFLAALGRAAVPAIGADLVFAKLWLARHFVSPDARLLCFDAQAPWPLPPGAAGTAFCHDAFYFLPDKPGIVAQMRALVGEAGAIAIGHAHNADADNHSSGRPLSVAAYAALLPGAALFDDLELTRAFVDARGAEPADARALSTVAAVSLLWRGPSAIPAPDRSHRFGLEPSGRTPRLNPLYERDSAIARIRWPSERYRAEYAALASYPAEWSGAETFDPADPGAESLLRRRVFVELPPRW